MIVFVALVILLCVTFALGLIVGHAVVLRWALALWAIPTVIVVVPVLWLYMTSVIGQLASDAMSSPLALVLAQFGGIGTWLVLTFSMIALAGLWTGHRMANSEEAAA